MPSTNSNSLNILVRKVAFHLGVKDIVAGSSPYESTNDLSKDVAVWVESIRRRYIRDFSFYFSIKTTTFESSITDADLIKGLLGNLFDGQHRYAYRIPSDFLSVCTLSPGSFSNNLFDTNAQSVSPNRYPLLKSHTRLYKGKDYLITRVPITEMEYYSDMPNVSDWTSDFLDLVSLAIANTLGPSYLGLEGKASSKLGFRLADLEKQIKYNALHDSTFHEVADG